MLTLDEVLQSTKGKLIKGRNKSRFKGVSLNSRDIQPGELFIAIKGDRFDGHDFINRAIKNKAAGVVLSKKVAIKSDIPVVYVKDTIKALGQIAHFHRRRFSIPFIAITGSTGKTTTKDLIAHLLAKKFKILKNEGTQNNHIGVPKTLLKLRKTHQCAVIELGTSEKGDIRTLTQIVDPDMAVFTNIGISHLEGLKSVAGVFNEKYDLVRFMKRKGVVVYNADDQFLQKIGKRKMAHKKRNFSIDNSSNVRAVNIRYKNSSHLKFNILKNSLLMHSPAVHNIYNCLAAITVCRELNLSFRQIRTQLSTFKFTQGRFEVNRLKGMTVIDDSYNANPISVLSAIDTLNKLQLNGKKIVVIGDMLELGKDAEKYHREVAHEILRSEISSVFTYGPLCKAIDQTIRKKNNGVQTMHFDKISQLNQRLKQVCRRGDAVLIKGSRGMRMERTMRFLKEQYH